MKLCWFYTCEPKEKFVSMRKLGFPEISEATMTKLEYVSWKNIDTTKICFSSLNGNTEMSEEKKDLRRQIRHIVIQICNTNKNTLYFCFSQKISPPTPYQIFWLFHPPFQKGRGRKVCCYLLWVAFCLQLHIVVIPSFLHIKCTGIFKYTTKYYNTCTQNYHLEINQIFSFKCG